jgi:hypothetical protein
MGGQDALAGVEQLQNTQVIYNVDRPSDFLQLWGRIFLKEKAAGRVMALWDGADLAVLAVHE